MEDVTEPKLSDETLDQIKTTLEQFTRPNTAHGLLRIFTDWAVILIASSTYFLLPSIQNPIAWGAVYFVSICVIGGRMRGLESCAHEATHHTLFKSKKLTTWLEPLYAWPILTAVEEERHEHMIHHYHMGSEEDPTYAYYREAGIFDLPHRFFWTLFIRPFLGGAAHLSFINYVTVFKRNRVLAAKCALFWALVLTAVLLTGATKWFLMYYVVPLVVIFPFLEHLSEIGDHVALDCRNKFTNTRNNLGPFLHRFFINAHGDGHHLVHHLNPSIPTHLLKPAHRALMQIPEFANHLITSHSFNEMVQQVRARKTIDITK